MSSNPKYPGYLLHLCWDDRLLLFGLDFLGRQKIFESILNKLKKNIFVLHCHHVEKKINSKNTSQ